MKACVVMRATLLTFFGLLLSACWVQAADPAPDPVRKILLDKGYQAIPIVKVKDDERGLGDKIQPVVRATHLVKCSIAKVEFYLQIDTGATDTIIYEEFAKANKIPFGAQGTSHTLGGKVAISELHLNQISFGGLDSREISFELSAFAVKAIKENDNYKGLPIAGILGNDKLLATIAIIDYSSDTLYMIPPTKLYMPKFSGSWKATKVCYDGLPVKEANYNLYAVSFTKQTMKLNSPERGVLEYSCHYFQGDGLGHIRFYEPKQRSSEKPMYAAGGVIQQDKDKLKIQIGFDPGFGVPGDFELIPASKWLYLELERETKP
jgi:hypothetical protein